MSKKKIGDNQYHSFDINTSIGVSSSQTDSRHEKDKNMP